jgi:Uma2 family endonuclease
MHENISHLPTGERIRATTQAADGVPRLRWTLKDFDRLTELGVVTQDDRIELIGGDLVPMAAKGDHHEVVRGRLHNWLIRRLPETVNEMEEMGWRPDAETYLEPDIMIYPSAAPVPFVPADQVLLMIEVSHSNLWIDLGLRAKTMAALGVREYWVVNAIKHDITVHRDPSKDGFRTARIHSPNERIVPLLVPELALRMADLGYGD